MKINNKKILLVLSIFLGISLVFTGIKAASDLVGKMSNQEVNVDQNFQQARLESQGQGFFNIIDSEILAKNYSYKGNKNVKMEVDKLLQQIKDNGVDYAKEYNFKDNMEYLERTGNVLKIQRDQYVRDQYIKQFVTEASLKELYNKRRGEVISYGMIKLDIASFENDPAKVEAAKKEIQDRLKNAKPDELQAIFKELGEKYQSSDSANGIFENKAREEVVEGVLAQLDKMKPLEATKSAISIDGSDYFILRISKLDRPTFKASKEKLTNIQLEDALQANSSLSDFLLVQLRKNNEIKFKNDADQVVYNAANQQIIDAYNKAIADAKKEGGK